MASLSTAFLAVALIGAGCHLPPQPPAARTDLQAQGRHVLLTAGGCGCHGANFGGWRSGGPDSLPRAIPYGERFVGRFGTVPAPNITQDPGGIGGWTDVQIATAITEGRDPSGTRLTPIMPYRAYHGLSHPDLKALVAYLRRLRPVSNSVPVPDLKQPIPDLGAQPPAPESRPSGGIALGQYLVRNVSSCADCHASGPPGSDNLPLSGGKVTLDGKEAPVPNITPDRSTGIGSWSEEEIARYLRTGARPDGGVAQSAMAGLILTSFSHFTPEEADAIAAYLKSQPAIRRRR
ncbi:MAG TPA: c-type cytochrome [Capsulimonadaceae bacterium]|nr:c-type cytochrome [Capsulimonadaceae bacterium]